MTARLTYVPAGFILGAAFPLCALVFAHLSGAGPAETNFAAYASQAQAGQPLYYLLDLAPLLLAFLGLCIGAKQDAAQRLATVLRREVNKKSEALARVANDLETRKRLEMQLAHQAFHDPLTHLANRALFTDRTEHALLRSGSKKHEVAVLMLGLDDFKTVNDILGHDESALVDDRAENLALFNELKALGIRLAIDDFGTGYSSLSYLQRFPFDILKIDKSFVDGVAGGGTDVAFARTIIALGGMLDLRVLAEGIEHENQLAMLKELGCQYGQGYLFAKPLDTAAMTALLDSPRATGAAPAPYAVAASF